jgi:hypothetical protein
MIKIGKVIYNILSGSTEISNLVDDKIYPIVIPENTSLPTITYERRLLTETTKDNNFYTVNFDINVYTDNYKDGIDIADKVDGVLNSFTDEIDDYFIQLIYNDGIDEMFNSGVYIQKLTYIIKCYKKN